MCVWGGGSESSKDGDNVLHIVLLQATAVFQSNETAEWMVNIIWEWPFKSWPQANPKKCLVPWITTSRNCNFSALKATK